MILVTGASGLIGKSLVKSLISQGEEIKVLHRENSDLEYLKDEPNATKLECSLFDTPLLLKELVGVKTIIHAAALVSFQKADKEELFRVNVEGTRNLVNVALALGIDKIVYLSSIAALGRKANQTHVDESSKWVNSGLNSNYAKSKYLGELEIWRGFEEGLNGFVVNPSVVLGKGDWTKSSAQLFKFINENRSYYPEGFLNFVDLRDVRDCILKLLKSDCNHERYILNGGQVSYKDFFAKASSKLGFKEMRKSISVSKLKGLYWLDTIRVLLTGKRSLITKETILSLKHTFHYSSDKVLNSINHQFRTIDEVLNDVIPYYIKKYKL